MGPSVETTAVGLAWARRKRNVYGRRLVTAAAAAIECKLTTAAGKLNGTGMLDVADSSQEDAIVSALVQALTVATLSDMNDRQRSQKAISSVRCFTSGLHKLQLSTSCATAVHAHWIPSA